MVGAAKTLISTLRNYGGVPYGQHFESIELILRVSDRAHEVFFPLRSFFAGLAIFMKKAAMRGFQRPVTATFSFLSRSPSAVASCLTVALLSRCHRCCRCQLQRVRNIRTAAVKHMLPRVHTPEPAHGSARYPLSGHYYYYYYYYHEYTAIIPILVLLLLIS